MNKKFIERVKRHFVKKEKCILFEPKEFFYLNKYNKALNYPDMWAFTPDVWHITNRRRKQYHYTMFHPFAIKFKKSLKQDDIINILRLQSMGIPFKLVFLKGKRLKITHDGGWIKYIKDKIWREVVEEWLGE